MAKKKTTQQSTTQDQEENKPPPKNPEPEYMEDPKDKLKSLKALNAMLLKETVERRQQVDSLVESNGSLKSELTRVESEREALRAELARLADSAAMLEIEGEMVGTVVSAQGKEVKERGIESVSREATETEKRLAEAEELIEILKMEIDGLLGEKREIESVSSVKESDVAELKKRLEVIVVEIEEERRISTRVCRERDEMKAQLEAQIEEANVLAGKLKETEKGGVEISEEVEKLKKVIVKEKEERERMVEAISLEKAEVEKSLADSEQVIDGMVIEKYEIEKVMSEKEIEIGDLKKKLDEIVVEIEKEREISTTVCRERDEIKAQLDDQSQELNDLIVKLKEAEKKEAEIGGELTELKLAIAERKEENRRQVESILREKREIEQRLVKSNSVIDEMKRDIEEMIKEKEIVGEEKSVQEREKSELMTTITGLNGLITGLKEEEEVLRQSVADFEKKCAEGLEKERQMEIKIDGLEDEKKEMEKILESLIEEKSSVMQEFKDAKKNLESQMQKLEEMSLENIELEKAKNEAESEVADLKKQLNELNDTILSLEQSNSQTLESLVVEKSSLVEDLHDTKKTLESKIQKLELMSLEKAAIDEAKSQAESEIFELKKQSSELMDTILSLEQSNRALESLVVEKNSVMKDFIDTRKNSESQILELEQMCQEKIEIEKAKNRAESEIVELKKQLDELSDTILSLEQTNLGQIDMIKKLEYEVGNYKAAFDETATEKNKAAEGFEVERLNGMKMREKVSEMEKGIEEMQKLVEEMKMESSRVAGEKNELESQSAVLNKTITSLEKKLVKAQKDCEDMESKAGLADARSKLVLSMLRNTASLISVPNEGEMAVRTRSFEFARENADGEEMKPYTDELEAIKKAFEGRESKVEDMKRQLEFLEKSVAETHKGMNIWTLVSSATFLAAASIAYVARSH